MSDDISAMVDFLRTEYAEAISRAREIGNVLVTRAAGELGLSADRAERQARLSLHSAEMRAQFFEQTVVPYLGYGGTNGADRPSGSCGSLPGSIWGVPVSTSGGHCNLTPFPARLPQYGVQTAVMGQRFTVQADSERECAAGLRLLLSLGLQPAMPPRMLTDGRWMARAMPDGIVKVSAGSESKETTT